MEGIQDVLTDLKPNVIIQRNNQCSVPVISEWEIQFQASMTAESFGNIKIAPTFPLDCRSRQGYIPAIILLLSLGLCKWAVRPRSAASVSYHNMWNFIMFQIV